jgi:hypothetical protein
MSRRISPKVRFPFRTKATIWLTGNLQKGGTGYIAIENRPLPVSVPPLVFGLIVALTRKAKRDAATDHVPWLPIGFLTRDEIHSELRRLGFDADSDYTVKLIYRARRLLDQVLGRGMGVRLIEHQKQLGYRISTRPGNLFLVSHDTSNEF